MGRLYKFLGLTVGVIVHDLDDRGAARQLRLRHHLRHQQRVRLRLPARQHEVPASNDCVQREHNFAIVDEVDSILIDEARTPLIISGPERGIDRQVLQDQPHHPQADSRRSDRRQGAGREVHHRRLHRRRKASHRGAHRRRRRSRSRGCSAVGNLYEPANMEMNHHVQQALKAHVLFQRDKDYVVKDGEVMIVDEFTGRLMPGRRWSDGLHQAVEAKEGVKIERENQTLATITFQNYFRMYKKLAGMTGTAETEAAEFEKIYKLEVTVIPTNRDACAASRIRTWCIAPKKRSSATPPRKSSAARERPAGAGGHGVGREIGEAVGHSEEDGREARGSERQESRARSEHHRPGRTQRRGHGLDQHGRPRYRYSAGRQSGVHGEGAPAAARQGSGRRCRSPPWGRRNARSGTRR